MSFISREEFKSLANADLDKLYDYLTEKFNALESKIEQQYQTIKELESRLNQNSKNSHKPPSSDMFKKERDRKTSRRKSGGQNGHNGNNLKINAGIFREGGSVHKAQVTLQNWLLEDQYFRAQFTPAKRESNKERKKTDCS